MGTIAKTDAQLVEASRRGELEAFGHLVERYQDVVCAVGYSATGDRVLGEDVAQDTFVAAWQQLDRVRDVMRIGPWLWDRPQPRPQGAPAHASGATGDPAEQAAIGPSAFELLASRDAERVVRDALARVPDSYREVLVLYYREERSVHEVARALGISEEAVMQRLTRGRRYLADSVTTLVERSLRDARPRRDRSRRCSPRSRPLRFLPVSRPLHYPERIDHVQACPRRHGARRRRHHRLHLSWPRPRRRAAALGARVHRGIHAAASLRGRARARRRTARPRSATRRPRAAPPSTISGGCPRTPTSSSAST